MGESNIEAQAGLVDFFGGVIAAIVEVQSLRFTAFVQGTSKGVNHIDSIIGIKKLAMPTNQGRFAYTGQMYLDEIGLYYYKARIYNPKLGRFMQTDPIGYADGMNWYAYVGNDPINMNDPSGKWMSYVGGFLVGAGVELASQALSGEGIQLDKVGKAGLAGLAGGGITGLAKGAGLIGKLASEVSKRSYSISCR